jgi:hypothetical protein
LQQQLEHRSEVSRNISHPLGELGHPEPGVDVIDGLKRLSDDDLTVEHLGVDATSKLFGRWLESRLAPLLLVCGEDHAWIDGPSFESRFDLGVVREGDQMVEKTWEKFISQSAAHAAGCDPQGPMTDPILYLTMENGVQAVKE